MMNKVEKLKSPRGRAGVAGKAKVKAKSKARRKAAAIVARYPTVMSILAK